MQLELIQKHTNKPRLYEKGTSVMWTDPYIARQLLELHINPDHDLASRSKAKIETVSNWILEQANKPAMNILDLGCGPGHYAELFAKKGHTVTGVDFSENSIRYATRQAQEKQLVIEYIHENYLDLDFENRFDLAIMIYLDFCVLLPEERDTVLGNVYRALKPGGLFIWDVVNERNLEKKIMPQNWEVKGRGFWKDAPYLALANGYHFPEAKVFANHHIVIGDNDTIDTYVFWNHYYQKEELLPILASRGFASIHNHEQVLPEGEDAWNGENITFYTARK